jgi:hypothetical protein
MRLKKKCEVKGCTEPTKSRYGTCNAHKESSLHRRYRTLNKHKRKYKVNINYNTYCDILVFNNFECFYCGSDISGSTGTCLDRMDNKKGYNKNNVVVCCGICNNIKGSIFSFKSFKKFVDIYKKAFKIRKKPKLGGTIWRLNL